MIQSIFRKSVLCFCALAATMIALAPARALADGACCSNTAGTCTVKSFSLCSLQNGTYGGEGSTCAQVDCRLDACCRDDGTGHIQCAVVSVQGCSGVHLDPVGSTCAAGNNCSQIGRCCDPNGTCTLNVFCPGAGVFTPGASCAGSPCPLPGACCSSTSICTTSLQSDCTGTWTAGSCTPTPCQGACCGASGACSLTLQSACAVQWTAGTCSPSPCPAPGACCHGVVCTIVIQPACTGGFVGAGSVCSPQILGGTINACCHADYDNSGQVTVSDIFSFLRGWFAGCH